jgi:hypothetical protein
MSTHIIDLMAKKEGMVTLPKVDPNTQSISPKDEEITYLLPQAAIASVLAAFYKYSRDENNAATILQSNDIMEWPDKLFGHNKSNLVVKIAAYAGVSSAQAKTKINKVIADFIQVLKEVATEDTGKSVKNILTAERSNILLHLPAVLGIGKMIDDTTLDDRTNKMEGPVSGLMHKIEKTFAGSDNPSDNT